MILSLLLRFIFTFPEINFEFLKFNKELETHRRYLIKVVSNYVKKKKLCELFNIKHTITGQITGNVHVKNAMGNELERNKYALSVNNTHFFSSLLIIFYLFEMMYSNKRKYLIQFEIAEIQSVKNTLDKSFIKINWA